MDQTDDQVRFLEGLNQTLASKIANASSVHEFVESKNKNLKPGEAKWIVVGVPGAQVPMQEGSSASNLS